MTSAPSRAAATAAAHPAGPPPTTNTSVSANTGTSRPGSKYVRVGRLRRPSAPRRTVKMPASSPVLKARCSMRPLTLAFSHVLDPLALPRVSGSATDERAIAIVAGDDQSLALVQD